MHCRAREIKGQINERCASELAIPVGIQNRKTLIRERASLPGNKIEIVKLKLRKRSRFAGYLRVIEVCQVAEKNLH